MSALAQPAPQEIQRKLAVHTNARKATKGTPGHVSGTESDSDSIQTPDVLTPMSLGVAYQVANSSNPPLSSIAERGAGSGEDSDEEDHADSGWKTPDNRTKPVRNTIEDTVLKSGYLWKKGERRKTWKKRWFVLRPAHLAYYKSSAEYQLLRLLDLSDIHSCTPVNLKRHDNTFGLISPNRTFYFQAGNPEEVREWVDAIEEARQSLLATSTQNSASTPIPIVRSKDAEQARAALRNLTISTSPGQLVTSSDSEDGGGFAEPRAPALQSTSQSAPSPTAINFQLPAPPQLKPTTPATATTPSTSGPGKAVMAGYLMKCGSKRRTWRKRWFVLTGEKLQYSGSHMETKPHRVIPFTEILDALEYEIPNRHHATGHISGSAPPATTETDGEPANHTFKIVTTKRNLLLCAPTEEDEIKWLGAIRALIARRSGSGVVPGKTPKNATAGVGLGVSGHSQEVSGSSHASAGAAAPASVAAGRSRTRRPSASGGSDGEITQLKP